VRLGVLVAAIIAIVAVFGINPSKASAAPASALTAQSATANVAPLVSQASAGMSAAAVGSSTAQSVTSTVSAVMQQQAATQLANVAQNVMYAATATALTSSTYTGLCQGGISKGAGLKLGNDYVVVYNCTYGGHTYALLCPDPTKPASNPYKVMATTSISGASNFGAASYVAWNYARLIDGGQPKHLDNTWAAATRLVFWTHTGQAARAKADLAYGSSTLKSLYNTMLTSSVKYAGPYKVSYVSKTYPTLNTVGYTKFRLTSAKGYGVPGVTFTSKITSGNATLTAASVKTDANGYFTVSYKRTKWGVVSASSTSSALASTSIRYWVPVYTSYQRFYSGLSTVVSTSFSTDVKPQNIALSYNCVGVCDKVDVVGTKVCNTYNGAETRAYLDDNGVIRSDYITVGSTCVTPSWKVADNHHVRVRLSVLVNGVWVHSYFGYITVDCPPWPQLQFSGSFDCHNGVLNLVAPANPNHPVRLVVNGVVYPKDHAAIIGEAVHADVTFPCDSAHSYTAKTGVQRTNGAWNDSPAMTVGFPKVG
jgi:hypothetical protein